MTLHESTKLSPELWARLYRVDDGEQQPISAVEREFGLETQRKRHGLALMRPLMEALGNPHLRYPVIHVTGSKGKGSTAAIIAAILRAAGLRVGLYTSPALTSFHERIQIDGCPIPDGRLEALVADLLSVLRRANLPNPRFFEAATAIAFEYFAREQVDVAVIEVGIGGKRDATNVVRPSCSVITSIELEHTAILGDTLDAIAREKGGIIKHPAPVVSAVNDASARGVILEIARAEGVPCYEYGKDFWITGSCEEGDARQRFDVEFAAPIPIRSLKDLELSLPGRFQQRNAVLAITSLLCSPNLGPSISAEAIRRGLREVVWPGRLERRQLGTSPVLLDVAHTPASVECMVDYVRRQYAAIRPRVLVLGVLRDKPLERMMPLVSAEFDLVVAAPVKWYRSADPEVVSQTCLSAGLPCRIAPSIREAVLQAAAEAGGGLIVVAGSVFAVGEAKRAFGWTDLSDSA